LKALHEGKSLISELKSPENITISLHSTISASVSLRLKSGKTQKLEEKHIAGRISRFPRVILLDCYISSFQLLLMIQWIFEGIEDYRKKS